MGEYIQFVSYAIGSSNELEVYLSLANDLGYIERDSYTHLISIHAEVSKMLNGLKNSLENRRQQN